MKQSVMICQECRGLGWIFIKGEDSQLDCPACGGEGCVERPPKPRVVKMRKGEKYE